MLESYIKNEHVGLAEAFKPMFIKHQLNCNLCLSIQALHPMYS